MTTKPSPAPTAPAITKPGPLAGWIEVFKAGTHTDASGKRFSFGAADLDQMAHNHTLGAAPAVLGHPKHDDPAYAWVDGFKREGDSLYAQFKDINPAFEAGVSNGAYRNRSVSVFKDADYGWRVRHVGWLGAVPPAIDGLKPVNFAADEVGCLEFAAPGYSLVWGLESVAKLLRSLRDKMIDKDGLEAADAALPQYQIDGAMEAAAQAREEFQDDRQGGFKPAQLAMSSRFSSQPDGDVMTITQEQLDAATAATVAAQAQAAQAQTEVAQATAQFAAAQTELATLKAAGQKERNAARIERWKTEGKLLAHEAEGMAEYMASLDSISSAAFTFSKGDSTEVKQTPYDFHVAAMNARAPLIKLGVRQAGGDSAAPIDGSSASALADTATEYMKAQKDKGFDVSLPDAMAFAVKQAA